MNELIKAGEIEMDGNKIKLEFFLGGDYKVMTINNNLFYSTEALDSQTEALYVI